VEWNNPADPTKGFRYMYLSDADYASVSARADTAVLKADPLVTDEGARRPPRHRQLLGGAPERARPRMPGCATTLCGRRLQVHPSGCGVCGRPRCTPPGQGSWREPRARACAGERRWRVTDVVGAEDGLGVECLSGSGAIASAYARAFREGFTITLVSGRTVGIGAYLARLGRRRAPRPADLRPHGARSLQRRRAGTGWGDGSGALSQTRVRCCRAARGRAARGAPVTPSRHAQVHPARRPAHHPDRLRGAEQAAGARGLHVPHAARRAQGGRPPDALKGLRVWRARQRSLR